MKHLKIFLFILLGIFAIGVNTTNAYETGTDVTVTVSHSVIFNANEGSGTMASQSILEGGTSNLNANTFIKDGYNFAGWSLSATGSTIDYLDGASFYMNSTVDVNLYAVWVIKSEITIVVSRTITFNANGGTGTMASQSILEGGTSNLNANTFIKDGYNFAGWSLSATGSTIDYLDGASFYMNSTVDVNLYAVWVTNINLTVIGYVTPTTTNVGVLTTFSSTIKNIGTTSTLKSFPYFFQIASDSNFSTNLVSKESSTMLTLGAGDPGATATVAHTFSTFGTYYMRVCADKTSPSGGGVINESDENDNCGDPTPIIIPVPVLPDLKGYKTYYSNDLGYSIYGYQEYFNAVIENKGNGSTGQQFNYLFQVISYPDGTIIKEYTNTTPILGPGDPLNLQYIYNVDMQVPYQVRVCADKTSYLGGGVITESDENNNCGDWSDHLGVASFDFKSGSVSPNSVNLGTNTFVSSIINDSIIYYSSDSGDGLGLPYLIQVSTGPDGTGTITNVAKRYNSDISRENSVSVSWTYDMNTTGTYSMRICADKYSQADEIGQIIEYNENNNCSDPWTNISVTGVMSGSLSGNTGCVISGEGDSCLIPVNWQISYPESSTTAITYINGPTETTQPITVSSSKTPEAQSGTTTASIYYSSSGRKLYLYNNQKELSTKIVTAVCDGANGYDWDPNLGHCALRKYTVSTYVDSVGGTISPSSASVSHGSTTSFTLTPIIVAPDETIRYVIDSVTGCGGTLSGNIYTTGPITSACTVTAKFRAMTGYLTTDPLSCRIFLGDSSCDIDLSWGITDPIGNKTAITYKNDAGVTEEKTVSTSLATPQSGIALKLPVPYGGRDFFLYNNSILLNPPYTRIGSYCDEDTSVWDEKRKVCAPSAGTLSAQGCAIEEGNSSCNVSLTWTTSHPVVISEITTPTGVLVATGNDGSSKYDMSCANYESIDNCNRDFFLYNGGDPYLDMATIKGDSSDEGPSGTDTIGCEAETRWDSSARKCVHQDPILSLTVQGCYVQIGASTCRSDITWDTEYPKTGVKSVLSTGGTTLVTSNTNPDGYYYNIPIGDNNGALTNFTLTNGTSSITKGAITWCVSNAHPSDGKCIIDAPDSKNTLFTATPNVILKGKSSTLEWNSQVATSCSIKEGDNSPVPVGINGTMIVTPTKTTKYTLTCTNDTDQVSFPLSIKVVTLNIKEN